MRRLLPVAAVLAALAAAAIVFLARERDRGDAPATSVTSSTAPARPPAEPVPPVLDLPAQPEARERTLERNETRALFEQLRTGFADGPRTPSSEARLLRALDDLFPRGTPRSTVECRRLVCRLAVEAPASEWRDRFAQDREVRRQVERIAFHPDGEPLAYVELVELRVADAPRPEGERILEEVERDLLASEAARRCVAAGPAPGGAVIKLVIDQSGVTYRFDATVDARVGHCIMMEAMPDVLGAVAAPAGVRRAERKVRITAAP